MLIAPVVVRDSVTFYFSTNKFATNIMILPFRQKWQMYADLQCIIHCYCIVQTDRQNAVLAKRGINTRSLLPRSSLSLPADCSYISRNDSSGKSIGKSVQQ